MKKISTKEITLISMLIALEIVLSRFLSFNVWNMKIGFSFVPVVVAAVLMGPVQAAIVAGLGDLLGAVLFPIGAYFPGFTFTAVLTGLCFGFFLHPRCTLLRAIGAVVINQLILSLFLNSLWISVLYGSPYIPLLATRLFQCAVLIILQLICIIAFSHSLQRVRKLVTL